VGKINHPDMGCSSMAESELVGFFRTLRRRLRISAIDCVYFCPGEGYFNRAGLKKPLRPYRKGSGRHEWEKRGMAPVFFKKTKSKQNPYRIIVMLSAWGFILVVSSFLFLMLGVILDEFLGTSPKFMLAMLFLAITGCLIELYQEIRKIIKTEEQELQTRKRK